MVEMDSVVIVLVPMVWVTGQVVVVVYTMTVVKTSCVDAGTAASLVDTAGVADAVEAGVGFAVQRVQTVITLVIYTVEVVTPVVTIWLPPDVMVDVYGQVVVYEVMVSVVTISDPLVPPLEAAPDDSVLDGTEAVLLVIGYGVFEVDESEPVSDPDGEPVPVLEV